MADNIPGETVVTTPSAPMGSTETHPVIAEHQKDASSGRRSELKGQAQKFASEAGSKARGAAEEGKAKAADTVKSLAQSTRDAAKQFEGTQAAALTGYVTTAADSIEKFGDALNNKSVDEIVADAREMVRRSPAIAIGAAAAVGFLISRFVKATERVATEDPANEDLNADTTTRYDA